MDGKNDCPDDIFAAPGLSHCGAHQYHFDMGSLSPYRAWFATETTEDKLDALISAMERVPPTVVYPAYVDRNAEAKVCSDPIIHMTTAQHDVFRNSLSSSRTRLRPHQLQMRIMTRLTALRLHQAVVAAGNPLHLKLSQHGRTLAMPTIRVCRPNSFRIAVSQPQLPECKHESVR